MKAENEIALPSKESIIAKGLYWEDFKIGASFVSGARTITEADVVAFAALSGDWNPLHTDAEFAKTTPFGRRIAHGLLGLSIASGLGDREGILEGTIVAFVGMEWKFLNPIFIGDTIHQKRTVTEKSESKKPDRAVLKFKVEIVNQDGTIVQEGLRTILVKRKQ